MGDGVYTLSNSLLQSLLEKERAAGVQVNEQRVTLPDNSVDTNSVTGARRDREARWICAIGRRLELGFNTVSVAITIFDRVLNSVVVQSKYVNCVALTSLYLAVKLHEECFVVPCRDDEDDADTSSWMGNPSQLKIFSSAATTVIATDHQLLGATVDPEDEEFYLWRNDGVVADVPTAKNMAESYYLDVSDFLSRVRVDYSPRELTRMESQILYLLDWDLLARPTCAQFLEAMLAVAGAPHLAASPALRTNFEAIATRWTLVNTYNASTLALALLSLMFQSTFGASLAQCVTQALADVFKIDSKSLEECRTQVADVLRCYHAHAQFLQRTLAARSHSASPFSCSSTARTSPMPMASPTTTSSGCASKELRLPTVARCDAVAEDVDAEIVDVLYGILDCTQQ